MNFFHFGVKTQSECAIEKLQTTGKNKIWHKCSEHKHYNGLPMESPLLEGEIYKKGEYELFRKHLSMRVYSDKLIFFKINAGKVDSHPHAIVFYELSVKVQWNFCKEKKEKEEKRRILGFTLTKNGSSVDFTSEQPGFLDALKEKTASAMFSLNFYDDFKILKPIGKGTSAIVYLCESLSSNEKFAVKACKKIDLYGKQDWKQILSTEISCLRAMDHPNIIKLHSLYETERSFCLVFDILQGGNLSEYLNKFPNGVRDDQCFYIMKGILSGLQHMHSKAIMHRDIKPENILFKEKKNYCDENNVCIADFGLSTSQQVPKYLFFRCGTPGYIDPEVLNVTDSSQRYSEKCDVFSAGAIMYHLLTGQKLFPGNEFNRVVILNRKAHMDFNVFKKMDVAEEAIDLLKKMLKRDSSSRISAEDALRHPYFNSSRLKLIMEVEECSLELREVGHDVNKNPTSFQGKFDFSEKNYSILSQNTDRKEPKSSLLMLENADPETCYMRETVMNGNLDTLQNISLHEIGMLESFVGNGRKTNSNGIEKLNQC